MEHTNNGKIYEAFLVSAAEHFVLNLPEGHQAGIWADISMMETGYFQSVYTKKLRGSVRELIVGNYRLIFFIKHRTIYFTSVFRKKSAKTPKKEIERAEQLYKNA